MFPTLRARFPTAHRSARMRLPTLQPAMHRVGEDGMTDATTFDSTATAIAAINSRWCRTWGNAHGWAPDSAADLLASARLDWQVDLSGCLRLWRALRADSPGELILAWCNLGSLVEGSLRLFLAVYLEDYFRDPLVHRNGGPIPVERATFDELRGFYKAKDIWVVDGERWDAWVLHIQQRRNAIHSFRGREIGTPTEFFDDMKRYLLLLNELDARMPEP